MPVVGFFYSGACRMAASFRPAEIDEQPKGSENLRHYLQWAKLVENIAKT
jgi:hypothetical protein